MILEILSAGLIISACLAIFLDEAVYAVSALAGAFSFMSGLYVLSNAVFAAIFQFAVAVGTLAILFLSGEMLSEKPNKKTSLKKSLTVFAASALLSFPATVLSFSSPVTSGSDIRFGEALWNLRAVDVVLQGLVMMTVALGTAIILYQKKKGDQN